LVLLISTDDREGNDFSALTAESEAGFICRVGSPPGAQARPDADLHETVPVIADCSVLLWRRDASGEPHMVE